MKRILYVSLLAFLANTVQAEDVATFVHPTKLSIPEQRVMTVFKTPSFLYSAQIGKSDTGKIGKRGVVYNTVDLDKISSKEDFTIKQTSDNANDPIYKVCIEKASLPGFDPNQGKGKNVWGFTDYESVEEEGTMWCFTLKKGAGIQ